MEEDWGESPRKVGLSEVKGNSIEYLTESSLGGKIEDIVKQHGGWEAIINFRKNKKL